MSVKKKKPSLSLEESFEVNIKKATQAKKILLLSLKNERKVIDRQIRRLSGKPKKKSKKAS